MPPPRPYVKAPSPADHCSLATDAVELAVVEKSIWSTFIVDAVRTAALIVIEALPKSVNVVLLVPDKSPPKDIVNTGSGLLETPVQSTLAETLADEEIVALDDSVAEVDVIALEEILALDEITALVDITALVETTALEEIIALEDIVALAILVGLLITPAQFTEAAITADVLVVDEPLTSAYETDDDVGALIATTALAAIVALVDTVADAMLDGLLKTPDQSTEAAYVELAIVLGLLVTLDQSTDDAIFALELMFALVDVVAVLANKALEE